ncbi:MAG: hypothetical protein GKS00_14125 [Alphaproteobacteria bacterium]|nr:hypothetical protein [Alphaproteobacteria bacterium]
MPSIKEVNYFIFCYAGLKFNGTLSTHRHRTAVTSFKRYGALFKGANEAKAIGEGSINYIYFPEVFAGIKELIPDA